MGGGFGGSEGNASILRRARRWPLTCCASPVKLRPSRDDDMLITGSATISRIDYDVGFETSGRASWAWT